MIKVQKQLKAGKYTVLLLDSDVPIKRYSKLLIDGKEYEPEIVYDFGNSVGVAASGDFEGKEVKFIE